MYPAGNLFIPAPHGRLEAIWKEPRGVVAPRGAARLQPPPPRHRGAMPHNVTVT